MRYFIFLQILTRVFRTPSKNWLWPRGKCRKIMLTDIGVGTNRHFQCILFVAPWPHWHYILFTGHFTRHYYVIVQSVLLPFYALVTWLFFKNNKINYAESLVLLAYALSFMFLLIVFTNLIDLISNKNLAPPYYEIPVLFLYLLWTYINFFREEPKWRVCLKTGITILIFYFASNLAGNLIVNWML